jgi:hypothetical protein
MNESLKFADMATALIAKLEPLASSGPDWVRQQARITLDNIRAFKDQAIQGTLPSSKASGLGISRALGEWAPDDICQAGYELERYFLENM